MISKTILHECHEEGFKEKDVHSAYKIFFGTLVSNSRLKIINLLRTGKKSVSEMIEQLNIEQTALSHDLARLRKCGFVKVETDGKYRYYSLNQKTISPLMKLIDEHMSQYCIHIMQETKKAGEKK